MEVCITLLMATNVVLPRVYALHAVSLIQRKWNHSEMKGPEDLSQIHTTPSTTTKTRGERRKVAFSDDILKILTFSLFFLKVCVNTILQCYLFVCLVLKSKAHCERLNLKRDILYKRWH